MKTKRLLIAAGGTGGHMFPAQSLAETLSTEGWQVAMMTDPRGHKHTANIPADPILDIPAATISPRKPIKAALGLVTLQRGTMRAKTFMREWRPSVVVGFGGYPAFPAMRAAQSLKLPTILHEQNAVLGRVNRVFAARANAVASGFEVLQRLPNKATHVVTGNPLRQQVMDAIPDGYSAPQDDIHLLVVGGSLGARTIAQTVPRAVAQLPEALRQRLVVTQQTTLDALDDSRAVYRDAGVRFELATFFSDIQTHLARAHLVIGRAGASSVSEFAAMGLPSILVPLAIAMDDHQTVNASTLARRNAAVLMPESAFTPDALAKVLEDKLDDTANTPTWLESAARAAKDSARPDATHALARLVVSAAG